MSPFSYKVVFVNIINVFEYINISYKQVNIFYTMQLRITVINLLACFCHDNRKSWESVYSNPVMVNGVCGGIRTHYSRPDSDLDACRFRLCKSDASFT